MRLIGIYVSDGQTNQVFVSPNVDSYQMVFEANSLKLGALWYGGGQSVNCELSVVFQFESPSEPYGFLSGMGSDRKLERVEKNLTLQTSFFKSD